MLKLFSYYLPHPFDKDEEFKRYLKKENSVLYWYAETLLVSLPKPRTLFYENSNLE